MAAPEDAQELLAIYDYYVKETAITFEYETPSVEEFRGRIEAVLERFPYIVAEEEYDRFMADSCDKPYACDNDSFADSLVAEVGGGSDDLRRDLGRGKHRRILGYAYASPFHARKAYQWCAEMSIYVRKDERGRGLGRLLYEDLERRLKEMGYLNLNACIGYPEAEDEHLTFASVRFHERMGYSMVGEFHKCGFKFGRWYNMVWMEKLIGEHTDNPGEIECKSV
jgi:phosphinothricin acetyltransferase